MPLWKTIGFLILTVLPLLVLPMSVMLRTGSSQAQTSQERQVEAGRLLRLGAQQHQTSQYEAALESWAQALAFYRSLQNRQGEAAVLNDLGIAYRSRLQYDKAIAYYQQALPILQQVKDRDGEALALNNLGLAYGSLSQYDKAIAYFQQAVKVYESVRADLRARSPASQASYRQSITPTYHALAQLLQQQGRQAEAQQVLHLLGEQ